MAMRDLAEESGDDGPGSILHRRNLMFKLMLMLWWEGSRGRVRRGLRAENKKQRENNRKRRVSRES
jgi:hypothetical protein